MSHVNPSAVHCINPDCQRPYPQPWGNRFCNSCGAPLQLNNRYVALSRLGSGGFAQIYTVWDQNSQTEKVLKVLLSTSVKAHKLFDQEAEVLKNLQHPGVPKVEPEGYFKVIFSTPKGQVTLPCLVMEKINGLTLEQILQQNPQGCPQEAVLNWLLQAVDILEHLHKHQIIHRDIKPSNLMLRNPEAGWEGQLVLIDFGGVKQISEGILRKPTSTRLFSSGFSPPEQITGIRVGPTADFYALGRTMITLLTGKEPQDLEDPQTGELHWFPSHGLDINPQLASLLDQMVQTDPRSRPANTKIIHKRLLKLTPTSGQTSEAFFSQIQQYLQKAIAYLTQRVSKTTWFIFKVIFKILRACLDTIWTMILTTLGACVGTFTGFFLAKSTILNNKIGEFIYQIVAYTNFFLATNPSDLGSQILLFGGAGLGTAWGLTVAGGFGQRRRYLLASVMGILGYGFGYLVLQLIAPENSGEVLVSWMLAAVSVLTLGLGLRSHHIVHAVITGYGTAIIFILLIKIGWLPLFDFSNPLYWNLWQSMAFFGLIAVCIGFWLGVSNYLVVPGLRFLGWR
ncbi:MAG: serine/threonine-protein kinase [Nostocaceae cyanobacterium]|nr:serine/threonine-protein kinase [Nostocaceae cyanobacterium]